MISTVTFFAPSGEEVPYSTPSVEAVVVDVERHTAVRLGVVAPVLLAALSDRALQDRIGRAAAEDVRTRFCTDLIVSQYEQCYRDVLASK